MLSVKRQIQSISGLLISEAFSVSSSLESVTSYLGRQNFCYSEPPKQYWQILSISPKKQYPEPLCKSGCNIIGYLRTVLGPFQNLSRPHDSHLYRLHLNGKSYELFGS